MKLAMEGETLEIQETGEGPTLVLVHGYPLDGAMWSPVARRLSDRFRVLKPDLPGRPGNPVRADGSMDSYADFISEVVVAAEGPVGLAGFSMGGYVALALMKRRPAAVAALALVDTRAAADSEAVRAQRDRAIESISRFGVEPVADAMVPKLLGPGSLPRRDLVDRLRRIILRQTPQALQSDLAAMRNRPDSTAFLKELAVPTLVIAGADDTISPPAESRAMADAIPRGRFAQVEAAGHLTPMEQPAVVANLLGEFFSETLRSV